MEAVISLLCRIFPLDFITLLARGERSISSASDMPCFRFQGTWYLP